MEFTKHSLDKIHLLRLSKTEIIDAINNPDIVCEDKYKGSKVYISHIRGKLYSVVVRSDLIITVYRTDEKKLYSRRRSGRWNCF